MTKLNWEERGDEDYRTHSALGREFPYRSNCLRNVRYEIEPAAVGGYLLRCCDSEGGIYDIRSDHLILTVELAKEIAQAVEDMNPLPWPPPGESWEPVPYGYLTGTILDQIVSAYLHGERIDFAEAHRRDQVFQVIAAAQAATKH